MADEGGFLLLDASMFSFSKKLPVFIISTAVLSSVVGPALSTGMVPQTSIVIVNEADGEASINVKNSDAVPALLYSSLQDLPEDTEPLLFITPPVARVEPGETQLVRFILDMKEPLKVQRMKRVIFEGIPPKKPDGASQFNMTVRQNLAVVLHPKGLAQNDKPWTLLKWSIADGKVSVKNDSPYVVRLGQQASLQPNNVQVQLPRGYILPGELIAAEVPADGNLKDVTTVQIQPSTLYGYSVGTYDASLSVHPNK